MTLTAKADDTVLLAKTYYSIGGGFIVEEAQFGKSDDNAVAVPYPYKNAEDILRHCREQGLPISSLMRKTNSPCARKPNLPPTSPASGKPWPTASRAASTLKASCRGR